MSVSSEHCKSKGVINEGVIVQVKARHCSYKDALHHYWSTV